MTAILAAVHFQLYASSFPLLFFSPLAEITLRAYGEAMGNYDLKWYVLLHSSFVLSPTWADFCIHFVFIDFGLS